MTPFTKVHRRLEQMLISDPRVRNLLKRISSYLERSSPKFAVLDRNKDANLPDMRIRPVTSAANCHATSSSWSVTRSYQVEIATGDQTIDLLDELEFFLLDLVARNRTKLTDLVTKIEVKSLNRLITSDEQQAGELKQWIGVIAIDVEIWARR